MDVISHLSHMTKIWSVWSHDSQQLIGQVMWPCAHQGAECTYRCGRAGFASGPPRAPPRWDWCHRRWSAQCQQEHNQPSVSDRGHFQMDESRWSAMSLGREGRIKFLFIEKSECYVVSLKQSSINFHSKHISVGSLPNMVIYLHNKGDMFSKQSVLSLRVLLTTSNHGYARSTLVHGQPRKHITNLMSCILSNRTLRKTSPRLMGPMYRSKITIYLIYLSIYLSIYLGLTPYTQ